MRQRWRRPYDIDYGLASAVNALFILGAGTLFCLIDLLAGGRRFGLYAVCWVLTGAVVRTCFVGLFVSGAGVRVRKFWRTYTVPWRDISSVGMRPRAPWGHQRIRIVTRRYTIIDTPVLAGPPGEWRPALYGQQRGGLLTRVLPPREFARVIEVLTDAVQGAGA
ncbi:PH domain-containing protein [Catellatospora sichuanensis]|uniref:PH domain-containing protein n=1 Tax=Catellatospora sichuanensis TaxID=1969805 RepID=UPI001642CCD7|nr:PH domain-containing protein [Catellatospora sichuanensis]